MTVLAQIEAAQVATAKPLPKSWHEGIRMRPRKNRCEMSRFSLLTVPMLLSWVFAFTAAATEFKSQLFAKGELIYSDEFDGELNKTHWMPRTKNWVIADGKLIGAPDYKDKEAAMKALKRDHHLGMSPVIRLDKLPKKYVVRMRLKYEGEFRKGQRSAKVDIGHHINNLNFTEEGVALKLSGGHWLDPVKIKSLRNCWFDLTVEFEEGRMAITIDDKTTIIKHEQVSMKDRAEFTFKTADGPANRILFDYVQIWKVD
jgi:hypothetical protein